MIFSVKMQSNFRFLGFLYLDPEGFWWLNWIVDKNRIVVSKTTFMVDSMSSTGYEQNWTLERKLLRYLQKVLL